MSLAVVVQVKSSTYVVSGAAIHRVGSDLVGLIEVTSPWERSIVLETLARQVVEELNGEPLRCRHCGQPIKHAGCWVHTTGDPTSADVLCADRQAVAAAPPSVVPWL